eukprot:14638937-Alexandrium_andersonii.AAC.1
MRAVAVNPCLQRHFGTDKRTERRSAANSVPGQASDPGRHPLTNSAPSSTAMSSEWRPNPHLRGVDERDEGRVSVRRRTEQEAGQSAERGEEAEQDAEHGEHTEAMGEEEAGVGGAAEGTA